VKDSRYVAIVFLTAVTCASAQGPYNNQNPYWPMTVGNKWVMRNPSTHSATIVTIQPPLSQYGCAPNVQPPAQQAATSPWEIDFSKLDPTNYWGHGSPVNLRWFLGVQPPNQLPTGYTGHLYGFGWEPADYSYGLPTANWTAGYINYDEPSQQIPAGLLGPPSGGGNYALDTEGLRFSV
jgi:hypothetical protein